MQRINQIGREKWHNNKAASCKITSLGIGREQSAVIQIVFYAKQEKENRTAQKGTSAMKLSARLAVILSVGEILVPWNHYNPETVHVVQ